jgi:hypothetical protein
MNRVYNRLNLLIASLIALSTLSISGVASALATPATASATRTAAQAADAQSIIAKGNQEINRRLTTLGTLSSKINDTVKLSASNKATLSSEVSAEINGLTALKAKLDADTTLADAKTDAQSIYTDYRVYALILPKVGLVKTADDQQVVEGKLTALATKLQTRITATKTANKDTASLQTKLDDLNAKVSAAQAISSTIEAKVIALQPSDYDSDHTILSGDAAQLKTAHADNQAAIADGKTIISSLKNL